MPTNNKIKYATNLETKESSSEIKNDDDEYSISKLIKDIHDGEIQFPCEPFCIHVDEIPICPLGRVEVTEPVLASNGRIYNESTLKSRIDCYRSLNLPFADSMGKKFEKIFNGVEYISIKLAFKSELQCKLHPSKYLRTRPNGVKTYLAFIGKTKADDNSSVIFIESFSECSDKMNRKYLSGQIIAYHFKKYTNNDADDKVVIETKTYSELEYYRNTQAYILVDEFKISPPEEAIARDYICRQEHVDKIKRRVNGDIIKANNGDIRYHFKAGQSSIKIKDSWNGHVSYNACSWARSVFQEAGVLKTADFVFDSKFKIKTKSWVETFRGETPDRVLPTIPKEALTKVGVFQESKDDRTSMHETTSKKSSYSCQIL